MGVAGHGDSSLGPRRRGVLVELEYEYTKRYGLVVLVLSDRRVASASDPLIDSDRSAGAYLPDTYSGLPLK